MKAIHCYGHRHVIAIIVVYDHYNSSCGLKPVDGPGDRGDKFEMFPLNNRKQVDQGEISTVKR